jgi:release factor glutamine methyltransferase
MAEPLEGPLATVVRRLAAALTKAGIEPAMTEARLIAELAGFDRMAMIRDGQAAVPAEAAAIMREALAQRVAGKPVARIRGAKAFAGADFALSPQTLEPRDDTETLIDAVEPFLRARPEARIIDIGTGTGIIAVTLLRRHPLARAVMTDISAEALRTAIRNAESLGVAARVAASCGDLFAGAEGRFDLVVSNPPYIPSGDIAGLEREVRDHDPAAALDGGPDGLDFYRRIALDAHARMASGGIAAVEIGYDQAMAVSAVFAAAGWRMRALHRDLGGRDRALVFGAGG